MRVWRVSKGVLEGVGAFTRPITRSSEGLYPLVEERIRQSALARLALHPVGPIKAPFSAPCSAQIVDVKASAATAREREMCVLHIHISLARAPGDVMALVDDFGAPRGGRRTGWRRRRRHSSL